MKDKRYTDRLSELREIFSKLPTKKFTLLSSTIETVAFMDIQLKDLEDIISTGTSTTPDKQLYSSMAKTRDALIKKLLSELPADDTIDDLAEFLSE